MNYEWGTSQLAGAVAAVIAYIALRRCVVFFRGQFSGRVVITILAIGIGIFATKKVDSYWMKERMNEVDAKTMQPIQHPLEQQVTEKQEGK